MYKFYDLYRTHPDYFDPNNSAVVVNNWNSYVNQQKSITETKDAWYAMLDGKFLKNRLSVVAGLRQEASSRKGRGPWTDSRWNYLKNPDGSLYWDNTLATYVQTSVSTVPTSSGYQTAGLIRLDQAWTTTTSLPEGNAGYLFSTTSMGTALRSRLTQTGIWYPDHVVNATVTPLEQRQLNLVPNRAINQKVKGDPSYSIATAYNIRENLVARVSWSRSFGLPSYESGNTGILSGNGAYSINENTPHTTDLGGDGTVKVANPGLKPSTSDNWDFEIGYYTKTGGKFTVSYFTKSVKNFAQTIDLFNTDAEYATVLEALGMSAADYENWKVSTSVNGIGTASTDGWEFDAQQNLGVFGAWGKHINVFANYTTKKLAQKNVSSGQGLGPSADNSGSAGIFLSGNRFNVSLKATYRALAKADSNTTNVIYNGVTYILYNYNPTEIRVDLNAGYQLTKRFSLFLSARDVQGLGRTTLKEDDFGYVPDYAKTIKFDDFGVQWTVGVNAVF
jgi:outer membrane receptor protein involved in Fe transport